jgi:myo-inositol 2-dehydrogenase/D-chiro-inositol 1-dehydrogenase
MEMDMLRVGIIGVGVMGSGHARYIHNHVAGAEIVAISDLATERVAALAAEFGTVKLQTSDPELLMNSDLVDAILIASPDTFHVPHLRLAIATGKPILCEKPMATSVADAREIAGEIAQAEEKFGRKLVSIGFHRRFDPGHRQVRELIESGKFGLPLYVKAFVRNYKSPGTTSTGLFTNMSIHDFDTYRWLFGSDWKEVKVLYPRASRLSEGIADPALMIGVLENGVGIQSDIFAHSNVGYDTRLEVVCESGSIEIGIHGDIAIRHNLNFEVTAGGVMDENWMKKFEPAYIAEMRAWCGEAATGVVNPDLATARDGLVANEVSAWAEAEAAAARS